MNNNLNLNLTFGKKSGSVGGGRPVFDQRFRQSRMADGAFVSNPPAVGGVIFTGDIAEFDETAHTCKHMKVFELAVALEAGHTTAYIKRGSFNHVLEAGLRLMVAPSSFSETSASIVIGTVTSTTHVVAGNVYSFAIVAGALGAATLPIGTLLVEAVDDGSAETYSVGVGGTNYVVGDILTAVSAGASGGTYAVTAVHEGTAEVATLTVANAATADGDVVITLNGIAHSVTLANLDSINAIASKIRNSFFNGWQTSGTGAAVIFTKETVGNVSDSTYTVGGTGATAAFVIGTAGTDATGAVTAISRISEGTGYVVSATPVATTTNSSAGANATITISAIGASMLIKNPNTCFTHDIYINETPAPLNDWSLGFVYAASLFNSATLLEQMATKVPAVVKAALRTGYSDIRVINYN